MLGGGGAGSDEGESLEEGGRLESEHLEGEERQEGDKIVEGGGAGSDEGESLEE